MLSGIETEWNPGCLGDADRSVLANPDIDVTEEMDSRRPPQAASQAKGWPTGTAML